MFFNIKGVVKIFLLTLTLSNLLVCYISASIQT